MKQWEINATEKRTKTLSCIPNDWIKPNLSQDMANRGYKNTCEYLDRILPNDEVMITCLDATALAEKIASKNLTSYQVCYAFCHRAALAHQILNCCIEVFFDEALETARRLDSYYATTGKLKGPLHGVPFSLKDQVNLPGIETTIGYISKIGNKANKMSLLAEVLQEHGAVFFVKTAVPTAMLASETVSSLHGRTLNALNISFSSGGSSGGEGSLIAAKGSPLGVGTDIGGSIRIPAAFQGLYGLRPSHGRIPYMDVTNSYEGQELIPSVLGPISSSLRDLELFTKMIIDNELWNRDPQVVPVPWRDASELKSQKLRFGLMTWDGLVMPHPPILRALKETRNDLIRSGHEVVDWTFSNSEELVDVGEQVYAADFYEEVQELLNKTGEPVSDYMDIARRAILTKGHLGKPLTVNEWWEVSLKIRKLKQQYLEKWQSTRSLTSDGKPIDAIICPVWPSASFCDGEVEFGCENYTVPFNVLDYACVVFPVAQTDNKKDKTEEGHIPVNPADKKMQDYYNAQKFEKMPVCLQIVCKRLEEEKALAITSVVESCLSA
ncbi:LAME_0C00518g1_1 [Lachancea meyersii CBS 8951]|uniref:amidase n=1 Tax=Lachancea meyersii CBS 8951 TaxID=1266667 RepID=A0A1G4IZ90_9SACH|nr:LAME_0C00518g1_1 [Lachancea meyersii CBS 8951]